MQARESTRVYTHRRPGVATPGALSDVGTSSAPTVTHDTRSTFWTGSPFKYELKLTASGATPGCALVYSDDEDVSFSCRTVVMTRYRAQTPGWAASQDCGSSCTAELSTCQARNQPQCSVACAKLGSANTLGCRCLGPASTQANIYRFSRVQAQLMPQLPPAMSMSA